MYEVWKKQQIHEYAGKMCRTDRFIKQFGEVGEKRRMGGRDIVRRRGRQGEVVIWCRKCSGYARQRKEPKLMSCCKPQEMGTKEYRRMLTRIQILEEGRVPHRRGKELED